MTNIRLTHPSYDGTRQARVAHGAECVLLLIESPQYRPLDGSIVLTPDEAHALGTRLQQQARASRRIDSDGLA